MATRRRSRRRGLAIAGALGILAVVLALVGLRDALAARSRLLAARTVLSEVAANPAAFRTPEGRASALSRMDSAIAAVQAGGQRVRGSKVLSVVGIVPPARGQRSALLRLIDDSETAAQAGRRVLAEVDQIATSEQLSGGKLPLDALAKLQSRLGEAGTVLSAVADGPAPIGPIGQARRTFQGQATANSGRLLDGAEGLGAARGFMGAAGPRRYLLALQNNAEMRNQGAVLSYVILTLNAGAFRFEEGGSVGRLNEFKAADVPLPPGTAEVFGEWEPNRRWSMVNVSADFALSGRMMVGMYEKATGERLDGVIAIDIPGVAGMLRVLGPVSIPDVAEPIGPDNIGRLLLHDFYEGLPPLSDQADRRERLGDVVGVVATRLTAGAYDAVRMAGELGDAAAGGHLKLWSSNEGEEVVFERNGLGGGPGMKQADRTFHLAVETRTATKLDYYVKVAVRHEVDLTPTGDANVHTVVTLDNTAPIGAPPSYQLGPDALTTRPGDQVAWVLLWGPAGSDQRDGGVRESGLNLSQRVVDVAAGERREFAFDTVVPRAVRNGTVELRLVPQPRLEPVAAEVVVSGSGWDVVGPPSWTGPLDRTRVLRWGVERSGGGS